MQTRNHLTGNTRTRDSLKGDRLRGASLRIGDFDVEPSLNQLSKGSETLSVEPRVMDLLVLLSESPGQVFSRDEILERVWPGTTVQDDALRRVVTLLRRVLDDDPKEPRYIETITRRGYRLVAPVTRPEPGRPVTEDGAAPASPASSSPGPASPGPSSEDRRETPGAQSPRRLAAILLVIFLIALAVVVGRFAQRDETVGGSGADSDPLELRPLTSLPGHESEPTFSPDGTRVGFIHSRDGERTLMVKAVDGGEARRILQYPNLSATAWSPDGERLLAVVGGSDCSILSVRVDDPSAMESLYTCSAGERLDQVFQPEEGTLILTRRPGRFGAPWRLHRLDLATGESTQLTLPVEPGYGDLFMALSPDRRRLAVIRHLVGERSKLLILDWATGAETVIDHFPDTSWRVSWSADAQSLVFADSTGLYRLALDGGAPQRVIPSGQDLRQPSVSPTGRRVAVVDQVLRSNIVRRPHPSTGLPDEAEVVASSTRQEYMPRIAPQGGRLAFISGRSGRAEIWATRSNGEGSGGEGLDLLFGVDPPNHFHAFLWSPDGDRIAVSDHQARLLIVDVAGGEPEVVPGSPFSGGLLDWSADGSSVYSLEITDDSPEVWKIRLDDGTRRQVTRCGVRAAQESPDGRSLYVTRRHAPGLWQVELSGDGRPAQILEDRIGSIWRSSERGIYSFESSLDEPGIYFRSITGRDGSVPIVGEPSLVLALPVVKLDFSVSDDHRWIAYAKAESQSGDILLIEG